MLIGEDIVVSPRTLALITLMAVSVFSGNARALAQGMFSAGDAYERFMGRWSREIAPQLVKFAGIRDGDAVLDVGSGPAASGTAFTPAPTILRPTLPFPARNSAPSKRVWPSSCAPTRSSRSSTEGAPPRRRHRSITRLNNYRCLGACGCWLPDGRRSAVRARDRPTSPNADCRLVCGRLSKRFGRGSARRPKQAHAECDDADAKRCGAWVDQID